MAVIKEVLEGWINETSIEYICQNYPTMQLLSNLSEQELMAIPGIGKAKARGLVRAFRLGKACYNDIAGDAFYIKSPEDAYRYCREMGLLEEEAFACIYINTKGRVLSCRTVSTGSVNATIVSPREIFAHAVRLKAVSFVGIHNHPSSDVTPSREDIEVTRRMKEAGRILGIELLDHLIIGVSGFTSLKEKGLMP